MHYQVYDVSTDLELFVKCYWTLEIPESDIIERQRIVPDGCMEMIFHFGDLYRQFIDDDNIIIQPRSFVFGQIIDFLEIEPTGKTGIFSVRFQPSGFVPFVSFPILEMINKAVSLEVLFGKEGIMLENQMISAENNEKRIEIIESFLITKLKNPGTIDKIIHSFIDAIAETQGQLNVNELSNKLKINRRKLERKFRADVGVSPKQIQKVFRIQNILKQINNHQYESFTELAYGNSYFDQAHFIKDFKEFTGLNPKQFFSKNLRLSTLFATIK